MPRGISRGLIGTANRFSNQMRPSPPDVVTENAMRRLRADAVHGSAWKEKMEWAQNLSCGGHDQYGRRVLTDAGLADARYVARTCRAAYRGTLPKNEVVWGHLRESIRRVYQDLSGGM